MVNDIGCRRTATGAMPGRQTAAGAMLGQRTASGAILGRRLAARVTQIKAGMANPAPPVGPALGQHGVNIMDFCNQFNERTKDQAGLLIPVVISVFEDLFMLDKLLRFHLIPYKDC